MKDNNPSRRKFLKTPEVKEYESSLKTTGDVQARLDNLGYPNGLVIGYGEDITTMGI